MKSEHVFLTDLCNGSIRDDFDGFLSGNFYCITILIRCDYAGSFRKRKRIQELPPEPDDQRAPQKAKGKASAAGLPSVRPAGASLDATVPSGTQSPVSTPATATARRSAAAGARNTAGKNTAGGAGRGGRGRGLGRGRGGSNIAGAGTDDTKAVKAEEPKGYQLPPDCDASVMAACQFTDKKSAHRSVPEALFQRWTSLRSEVRRTGTT